MSNNTSHRIFFLAAVLAVFPLGAETPAGSPVPTPPAAVARPASGVQPASGSLPSAQQTSSVTAPAPVPGSPVSAAVQIILSSSFALKDSPAVISSLVKASGQQTRAADKKVILSALADYEERLGLLAGASGHFSDAAFADPAARDDSLLLDSARCALEMNDTSRADGLVRAVLLTCFDDSLLERARVYSAWIQLVSGDRPGALALIRAWSANPVFSAYAPVLLFTLWWTDNDSDAKSRLLSSYPGSAEASIVRGKTGLAPSSFWYFMGKNEGLVAAFSRNGNAALAGSSIAQTSVPAAGNGHAGAPVAVIPSDTVAKDSSAVSAPQTGFSSPAVAPLPSGTSSGRSASASGGTATAAATQATPPAASEKTWQQAGFFRNRENADDLSASLVKKGFKAIVREEKRPSGTVYYSVVIPEDAERSVGSRLKDAGIESFLLVE